LTGWDATGKTRLFRREQLCQGIVAKLFTDSSSPAALAFFRLLSELTEYEGFLAVPDIVLGGKLSTSEIWERTAALSRVVDCFEKPQALAERLEKLLRAIFLESDLCHREQMDGEEAELSVPLYVLLPDPTRAVDRILDEILGEPRIDSPFYRLWPQLEHNLLTASGIDPSTESNRQPVIPSNARMETGEVIDAYLGNTPFASFFSNRSALWYGFELAL
jgi:hypothetical protein